MHRSGTSTISNILIELGVRFEGELLESDYSNPKGHAENKKILHINDNILKDSGGSWDAPPRQSIINNCFDARKDEIKQVLYEFEDNEMIGLKEPRMSLMLEGYLKIIRNPKIIYIKRCDKLVANSLFVRNGGDIKYWQKLSAYYNKIIQKALINESYIEVDFEVLKSNSIDEIRRISEYLEINYNPVKFDNALRVILNPKELHQSRKKKIFNYFSLCFKAMKNPQKSVKLINDRIRRYNLRKRWNANA